MVLGFSVLDLLFFAFDLVDLFIDHFEHFLDLWQPFYVCLRVNSQLLYLGMDFFDLGYVRTRLFNLLDFSYEVFFLFWSESRCLDALGNKFNTL